MKCERIVSGQKIAQYNTSKHLHVQSRCYLLPLQLVSSTVDAASPSCSSFSVLSSLSSSSSPSSNFHLTSCCSANVLPPQLRSHLKMLLPRPLPPPLVVSQSCSYSPSSVCLPRSCFLSCFFIFQGASSCSYSST